MKKYIGDKAFYKKVFGIILPIMLQQLFLSLAGYIDNIMINNYDVMHDAYNGVSAANRIMFVFNFVLLGLIIGVNIFTAQYFGSKNHDKVKETNRLSLYVALLLAVVGFILMTIFGKRVIDLYIQDANDRQYGYQYLNVIRFSNFFLTINMSLASAYRSIQKPKIPLIVGVIGIIVNIFFNWVLIFGKLGFQEMASRGAALATVISKVVETITYVLIIELSKNEWIQGSFKKLYVSKSLIKEYIKRGLPIVLNELSWSLSMVLMARYYTYHNDMWYNAYAYTQNISDLFFIVFGGLGNGTAIIIGSLLGQSKFDEAITQSNYFKGLGIFLGTFVGIIMFATAPLTSRVFTNEPESIKIMIQILGITGIFTGIYCYNAVSFFILRAGGDSIRAFILDQVPIYVISLPITIYFGMNASNFGITVVLVYLISHLTDIIKIFISNRFVNQRKWVRNLTIEAKN